MEPGSLVSVLVAFIVYFTDGTPLPASFIVPDAQHCTAAAVVAYAARNVAPTIPEGYALKDLDGPGGLLFLCLPVEQGTPGPAHIPAKDEA